MIGKCPPLEDFKCNCLDLGDGTIGLECSGAKLGDKKTSELLKLCLYSRDVSPLGSLDLAHNHLTKIPKELIQFKHLKSVQFHGNSIRTLKANDLPQTIKEINVADNSLINIEPGAFNAGKPILNYLQLELDAATTIIYKLERFM